MEIRITGSGHVTINPHGQDIETILMHGNDRDVPLALHLEGETVRIGTFVGSGNIDLDQTMPAIITTTIRKP